MALNIAVGFLTFCKFSVYVNHGKNCYLYEEPEKDKGECLKQKEVIERVISDVRYLIINNIDYSIIIKFKI